MDVGFDPVRRDKTLDERGLDFLDARRVFEGPTLTIEDDRFDYGEARFQTYGVLRERIVMVVWTARADRRRIISMRHCHERESERVRDRLG